MSHAVRPIRKGRLVVAVADASLPTLSEREVLAIRDELRQPWMRFSGTIEIDDPDASRSVDEVVYGRERP